MAHFAARAGSGGGGGAENQPRFIPADRTLFPLRRDASPPFSPHSLLPPNILITAMYRADLMSALACPTHSCGG